MRKVCLLLIGILFIIPSFAQKPISFISEYIDFSIDKEYFTINGIYNFRNNNGEPLHYDIPFPFASEISMVDSVSVIDLKAIRSLPFKKNSQGILFNVAIAGYDSTGINIYYRQKREACNQYILRSTQSWGEPLKKAVYTLTTDRNLTIKSFSIAPDSSSKNQQGITYYWQKTNFLPSVDFIVCIE
jgi:hypothetical protein